MLGEPPALGRSFAAADEQPGRNHVVIVSHSLWQRRLGGDPHVVGRTMAVDGTNVEIVGVMRAGFAFPDDVTELWQPLAFTAEDISEDQRGSHSYTIIGRLKPGATVSHARAEMKTLGEQMGAEHRNVYRAGFSASVRPLHEELVGNVGPALFVLLAGVGVARVDAHRRALWTGAGAARLEARCARDVEGRHADECRWRHSRPRAARAGHFRSCAFAGAADCRGTADQQLRARAGRPSRIQSGSRVDRAAGAAAVEVRGPRTGAALPRRSVRAARADARRGG